MKTIALAFISSISISFADSSTPPTASFGTSAITVSQSSGEVKIPVNVSGDPLKDFFGTTVYVSVVEGTATWPRDVDGLNGSVKFVTGESSKFLIFGLPSTSAFQGTRTFSVRLDNSDDYNVGTPSTIKITIKGDIASAPPVITTTNKNLSGGRVQVSIVATDSNGLKSSKKVIVKPKALAVFGSRYSIP